MTKEEAKKTLQDMWECLFNEMTTHTFEDLKEHGMLDNYAMAFDMAVSALSAEGEYIKKSELFDKTVRRNSIWNEVTNSEGKGLEEIVSSLPTYSIPNVFSDQQIKKICDGESEEYNTGYNVGYYDGLSDGKGDKK